MAIAPHILDEAAEWLAQHGAGPLDAAAQAEFERWRGRSPAHAEAWARAERLLKKMGAIPAALAHPALAASQQARRQRRATVARLAALLAVAPAGWLGWRTAQQHGWTADLRTATGERREEGLADGTQVMLSTASAIDVRFDAAQRLIVLRAGELLVRTAPDPTGTARPLRVATAEGRLEALGTRFSVRQADDGRTHLAVLEGAVRVVPHAAQPQAGAVVRAGEGLSFTAQAIESAQALDAGSTLAWTRGMLLADRMPLGEVAAEIARWRSGIVLCDGAVASIPVSGAFPLTDTDRALSMIASTYPVEARTRLRGHWITLVAR